MKSKTLACISVLILVVQSFGQDPSLQPRGLRLKCDGAAEGYTLFAPMSSNVTYLIDANGQAVRTWTSAFLPSAWVYLLDNGHVLRGGSDRGNSIFSGGGQGGRFQEFDLDGNLVWDFRYNETRLPHHDVAVLPNGNILAIAWEARTADQARQAGRRPSAIPLTGSIWPDMLIEFKPQPPGGAQIVWEWHIWDHLIQNINPALDNYGDPAQRPERININGDTSGGGAFLRDLFHTNAVAYNPELDQIILSVPTFNEIWVIDHSTTTQEAAGRTGGRSGKGGDLLYRWGNPRAYGRGTEADQLLGFQHDARWIPRGRPGAGHITVFSNRTPSPTGAYTKVYEFAPPVDAEGHYAIPDTGPFGPAEPVWTYSDDSLQTTNLSGAERLERGNTLISSGNEGRLFEITPAGEVVWDYWSPYAGPSGGSGNSFSLFRAVRIPPNHPGLTGHILRPMDPQPPISPFASVGPAPSGGCPTTIPPPTLTSIVPDIVARGAAEPVEVTLTGTNFVAGMTLDAGPNVSVSAIDVTSSSTAVARLTVGATAPLGPLLVKVVTGGGTSQAAEFIVADPFPDVSIVSSHTGNFGAGFDETYTVTVRNVGAAPTTGTITVTDTLPTGFTFVSGGGPGWSCSASGSVVTCTNSTPLSATESTHYTLTVAVDSRAASKVNHSVWVTTNGDLNHVNDTGADMTTVVAPSPVFVFTPYPIIPGRQAMVAVTMGTPFPHDITGSITLSFTSNAVIPVDDPAIQFASGSRTVTFTIPSNETKARFGAESLLGPLAFQTGSVAGTLTFAGTFTAGRIQENFSPGTNTLTIPVHALSIESLQTTTQDGLMVSMLLLSAAREVTQLSLSFNTVPKIRLSCGTTAGCSASGNILTLDVAPLFTQWFNENATFGGLAQLRLPFRIEGGGVKGTVDVTLRNTKGESNSRSFTLP